ncbi:MAG: DNA-deoxyinosine glycosylase, partial [Coriobacteriales bacterium]|nr:DNA-deoxyinosine glycosylase [Coriobacteriales bacterium]
MATRLKHPWPAVYDRNSQVLILGTFPSPASRLAGFPYGHPQNIFWQVLAASLGVEALPKTAGRQQRELWLLTNRVALWDVIKSCEISQADDS